MNVETQTCLEFLESLFKERFGVMVHNDTGGEAIARTALLLIPEDAWLPRIEYTLQLYGHLTYPKCHHMLPKTRGYLWSVLATIWMDAPNEVLARTAARELSRIGQLFGQEQKALEDALNPFLHSNWKRVDRLQMFLEEGANDLARDHEGTYAAENMVRHAFANSNEFLALFKK